MRQHVTRSCGCGHCLAWERALRDAGVAVRSVPARPRAAASPALPESDADRACREREAELDERQRALIGSFGESGWRSPFDVRLLKGTPEAARWRRLRDDWTASGDPADLERMLSAVTFTVPPDAPEPEPEPRFVLFGLVPPSPAQVPQWALIAALLIGVAACVLAGALT